MIARVITFALILTVVGFKSALLAVESVPRQENTSDVHASRTSDRAGGREDEGFEYRWCPHVGHILDPREAFSLMGEWEYRHYKRGKDPSRIRWRRVNTPYSGAVDYKVTRQVHEFRRMFTAPRRNGRRVYLMCEKLEEFSRIEINGRLVGEHGPGGLPFEYDVTDLLKDGSENSIFVRLMTDENRGHRPTTVLHRLIRVLGVNYPIVLEYRPDVHVSSVKVGTRVRGGIVLSAEVVVTNATTAACRVTVSGTIGDWSSPRRNLMLPPLGTAVASFSRSWPDVRTWTPDDPALYDLDVRVDGDALIDAYRQRFGFREVWVDGDKFMLNGIPILLKRDTEINNRLIRSDDDIRTLFRRFRRRGINGMRVPTSVLSRWADIADEEGLLISSFSNANRDKAGSVADDWWDAMGDHLREHVRQFRNHPSIVCWGVANEFGSFYGLRGESPERMATLTAKHQKLGAIVSAEDPTRPWTSFGDVEVGYPVKGPGPAPIRSFHYPCKATYDGEFPLPEVAWWYKKGLLSWQGVNDRTKPLSISEDIYHGILDRFPGMSRWGGDSIYEKDGFLDAWHAVARMFADGYYDAGIVGWNLWSTYSYAPTNELYDVRGPLHPDYYVALREPFGNLWAGMSEKRHLTVYNKAFTDGDVELVRETISNGVCVVSETWRFPLSAGSRYDREVEVKAPPCRKPLEFSHRYTLSRKGKILFTRTYDYVSFPRESIALPAGVVRLGDSVPDALSRAQYGIFINRSLTDAEGALVRAYVQKGGRVFLADLPSGSWAPIPIVGSRPQSFVFRRSADAMPGVTDKMLRTWRPDTLVGDSGYAKTPFLELETLFDSGHYDGLSAAQVARLYDGAGFYFLYQLPIRKDTDPAGPYVLRQALEEFERTRMPTRTLYIPPGNSLGPLLAGDGFVLAPDVASDAVWALDISPSADPVALDAALAHVRAGGTAFLFGVDAGRRDLLSELGLDFLPMEEPCEFVTRTSNVGLMRGISNGDLFFSSIQPSLRLFPLQMVGAGNHDSGLKGQILTGRLSRSSGSSAIVHTVPGAIAEARLGKGRCVVSTLRLDEVWKSYSHRALFLLKALFLNAGARSAPPSSGRSSYPVSLDECINAAFWDDPSLRGRGIPSWFSNGNDMRYFPVNQCGYSPDSRNLCPVETIPEGMVNYAGFRFAIARNRDYAGALVLKPRESKSVPVGESRAVRNFHFLGAMEKHAQAVTPALSVRIVMEDGSVTETVFEACNHFDGYRWAGRLRAGRVGWNGYCQGDPNAALYVWSMPAELDGKPIRRIEFKNLSDCAFALVALTAECDDVRGL